MKKVIIVIPVYKELLTPVEIISLKQLVGLLGKYHKCFVAPESLDINYGDNSFIVERFNDKYFKDKATYSELLLSSAFYQRFSSYEFMLIYQLDAFVFSDKLMEFCDRNIDYIGAPIPKRSWNYIASVGNGGFSLRNIGRCISILKNKEYILAQVYNPLLKKEICQTEDMFWGLCGTLESVDFKVASLQLAYEFAIEYNVGHCYEKLTRYLPFGCHRWYSDNFDVWWPIIKKYGYELDDGEILKYTKCGEYKESRKQAICRYLSARIIKKHDKKFLKNFFNMYKKYSIWGAGKDGGRCLTLLQDAGISVISIYDKNKTGVENSDTKIIYPSRDVILKKNSKIIIATIKYEREIKQYLSQLGMAENKDYISFSELERSLVSNYYKIKL